MSTINSITSYSMSLTDFLAPADQEENAAGSGLSRAARTAYGGDMRSGPGQAAMQRAVKEISAQHGGGTVTFAMVQEHREAMEQTFTLLVQAGLFAQGMTESEDFTLMASPEGQITIASQDPVLKEKIADLFAKNPEFSEQFLYIQALGNIEKTRQSSPPGLERQQAKADLNMQAVTIFLQAAQSQGLGYGSLLGSFDGGSGDLSFFMGANLTV